MGVVGLYKISQREWNEEKGLRKEVFKNKGQIGNLRFNKKLTNLLTMLHVLYSKATLQLTCTVKWNCTHAVKTRKITKKGTVRASWLLPTTRWKRYYLHAGNVRLNGFPA